MDIVYTKNLTWLSGFELSVSRLRNAIYFSIVMIPKKSHFTISVIKTL